MIASPKMQGYLDGLKAKLKNAYALANKARSKGLDPDTEVEIRVAPGVAERVEGLVGPKGISKRIRGLLDECGREEACFRLAGEIVDGKHCEGSKEELVEQAVRTGLALFTEGVVSAPIEGISRVRVAKGDRGLANKSDGDRLPKNPDGSSYVAVYFAGPIRGAGGTGQAFTLLLADHARKKAGLADYRPTGDETERYVEEINLYAARTRTGQYTPKEDEIRLIMRECPVRIDGDPTEKYEVSVHKDVEGIGSNRVRGGMCLVFSEGVCLKAAKIRKIAKKAGIGWEWIEGLIKVSKSKDSKTEIKPVKKFMKDLVGGRPVFAYPMRRGGFRLRYGRTPLCGIQSKALHPATMQLLDSFPAIGTQIKTERPGKGAIATPCKELCGPVVELDDGSIERVQSRERARELEGRVKKILFIGDLLVCFGDFLKTNHPLIPGAWCEEWLQALLEKKGVKKTREELGDISFVEAVKLAGETNTPLAPAHTLPWNDLSRDEYAELAQKVFEAEASYDWFDLKGVRLDNSAFPLLELLGVECSHKGGGVTVEGDAAKALLFGYGYDAKQKPRKELFEEAFNSEETVLGCVSRLSGISVKAWAGTYIGASMGRPEKSRERAMRPPVHSLFPIKGLGGNTRNVVKAVQVLSRRGESFVELEVNNRVCPQCNNKTWEFKCANCGERTLQLKEKKSAYQKVALPRVFDEAVRKTGFRPKQLKAVKGMISDSKTPEPMEKGVLRSKHGVTVFRDGTCRFDAIEVPLTHFRPVEIGLTVEKARELGYEVEDENQIVELKPQDIVVSDYALEYLHRVTRFVDDLLVYQYGLPAYYNCAGPEELFGKLAIAIAPHISAGITARIIGASKVRGLLAHPYLHCACRRNADGDELCIILLLDALLNFSLHYLPSSRGGKMDAPLVLTALLDPSEVDDEVHAMDCCSRYPLELFEAGEKLLNPSEVKVETVGDRLKTEGQYEGFEYTHEHSLDAPVTTSYVTLHDMQEKVEAELDLMTRIRAVDQNNAAERVILSHFLPDLYGNLRAFSRQKFRCVNCGQKYRRVPLSGKCNKCGGKLLLTISKGSIEKYLGISQELVEKYELPNYLKQRLSLIQKEIDSIFQDDKSKQFSLADYA
jgi:DNA polymerase II large subunit